MTTNTDPMAERVRVAVQDLIEQDRRTETEAMIAVLEAIATGDRAATMRAIHDAELIVGAEPLANLRVSIEGGAA